MNKSDRSECARIQLLNVARLTITSKMQYNWVNHSSKEKKRKKKRADTELYKSWSWKIQASSSNNLTGIQIYG